ncbi:zinc finger and SCAN domain-containing protein 2-like [Polypterus senegalus]
MDKVDGNTMLELPKKKPAAEKMERGMGCGAFKDRLSSTIEREVKATSRGIISNISDLVEREICNLQSQKATHLGKFLRIGSETETCLSRIIEAAVRSAVGIVVSQFAWLADQRFAEVQLESSLKDKEIKSLKLQLEIAQCEVSAVREHQDPPDQTIAPPRPIEEAGGRDIEEDAILIAEGVSHTETVFTEGDSSDSFQASSQPGFVNSLGGLSSGHSEENNKLCASLGEKYYNKENDDEEFVYITLEVCGQESIANRGDPCNQDSAVSNLQSIRPAEEGNGFSAVSENQEQEQISTLGWAQTNLQKHGNTSQPSFSQTSKNRGALLHEDNSGSPLSKIISVSEFLHHFGVPVVSLRRISADEILKWTKLSGDAYNCPFCCRSTRRRDFFLYHLRDHFGEMPYCCSQCGKRFSGKRGLDQHKQVHKPKKKYICAECGVKFRTKGQLLQHHAMHFEEKACYNDEYGKQVALTAPLRLQQRIPAGEQLYCCAECGKKFNLKIHFLLHQRIHQEKPFCCIECGKSFAQKNNLANHICSKTKDSDHCCSECGISFFNEKALRRHKQVHLVVEDHSFSERSITEDTKKDLLKPVKFHKAESGITVSNKHNLPENVEGHKAASGHGCNEGDLTVSNKDDLVKHMKVHKVAAGYDCSKCGVTVPKKKDLLKHMQVHNATKEYCCRKCDAKFSDKKAFLKHAQIHKVRSGYPCTDCDITFLKKIQLLKHAEVHKVKKSDDYCCNICGKSFSLKMNLLRHQQVHSGEKLYCCNVCGSKFLQECDLHTHQCAHEREKIFSSTKSEPTYTFKETLKETESIQDGVKSSGSSVDSKNNTDDKSDKE